MKIRPKFALRMRLWCVLFFNVFAVLCLVGGISYSYISIISQNKIKNEMQISANNLRYEIDYVFNDFSSMMTQLTLDPELLEDLKTVYEFQRWGDKHDDEAIIQYCMSYRNIKQKIAYLEKANSRIGSMLFYYYDENEELQIVNTGENYEGDFDGLFFQKQKIPRSDIEGLYIYVEAKEDFLEKILENSRSSETAFFLLTDETGQIIYSENETDFPVDTLLKPENDQEQKAYVVKNGKFLFTDLKGVYGIVQGISDAEYYNHLIVWSRHFGSVCILTVTLTAALAMFIWHIIYGPFKILQQEFRSMVRDENVKTRTTNIREFDELLDEFHHAQETVGMMSREIEERERKQKELEIEKLLIQINPHFIYNTLNCIQWLARLRGEKEISKMLSLFMRIIEYNLGKGDIFVTLQEEVEVIQCYVELQEIKNGQKLHLELLIEEELRKSLIPRFILQPVVENIILHGGKKEEGILIQISAEKINEDFFTLKICDNGVGMSKKQIEKVLNTERSSQKRDRGIGLRYVNDMVQFYCGEDSRICINSQIGNGTEIFMKLPVQYHKGDEYERVDC